MRKTTKRVQGRTWNGKPTAMSTTSTSRFTPTWRSGLGAAALVAAVGCGRGGAGDDPLDRMSARVYEGRPEAPPVQLSVHPSPRLYPPESDRLKRVRLDVTWGLADLGSEGKLAAWSFGGQIPGPTVRVRAGDRVRFTITNRTGEALQGLQLGEGPTGIEMGGVIGDREEGRRAIPPGQTLELEVTAMEPGVHLYRGATPKGVDPIAAGLYGLLVVDPVDGYATRVDREYALVGGEIYAHPDASGRRVDNAPLALFDPAALAQKQPTHVGYDGRFTAAGGLRLPAEPGERLRLFVLNAGPNLSARFQIQGLATEPILPVRAPGTGAPPPVATLLPGQGEILEVQIPKKGRYRFFDQQLAGRGLAGLIDAAQGEREPTAAELAALHPKTPGERREKGRELFADRCVSCHEPPAGMMRMAPDLTGVIQRRSRDWLVSWLTNPPKMQAEDPTAQQLLRQWNNVPMPPMMLSTEQIEWLLEFLKGPPTGKKS